MVHICRGEGEGHNFPLNTAIYTCGSCSVTFTTICTLHDHILDYELGGSFYYDGFTKTAFPKHSTAIAETQTGLKDRHDTRDIFRHLSCRQFSGNQQKHDQVKKDKPGDVCYHVSYKDANQQKKKAKTNKQPKTTYSLELDASFEEDNEAGKKSPSEDEDLVENSKTSVQPSTENETENPSLDKLQLLQSENSPHKEQLKLTIVEKYSDIAEITATDVGLTTEIIKPDANNKTNVLVDAPLNKTVQIKDSNKNVTDYHLRLATTSESNIDVGEYDNDYNESDREYGDFLDEHGNIIDPERTCNLEEEHLDVMKLKSKKTKAGSLLEKVTKSKNKKIVIEGHVMIKTEPVIEKQISKHTLDNAYVRLKRLDSTQNDSETLKQKTSETSQSVLAKMRKHEQRQNDMTLSKKKRRRKTQPVFDPLSRDSKVDIEDKFFKKCAAQQTRYDEKRKDTVLTEEIKVSEKRTTTRNKPRKSYHYSSEEEESDEFDEAGLVLIKEKDAALSANREDYTPLEDEKDPTFLPRKKKKKVNKRRNTDDLKANGKQKGIQPNTYPDYNADDNNIDDILEQITDGESNQADNIYTCNICQETMEESMKMKHTKAHKRQQKVVCYVCGISVQHRKFDDHVRTHDQSGETPFTCEICGKGLQTKSRLYTHKQSAHTVGKHKCKYCERTFHTDSHVRIHMKRIHTGEKNHLCPHCGKAFIQVYECDRHVKAVHLKIQPYECKLCFRRFARPSNYKGHMVTHSEERKTFECIYCNRKLLDKSSLRRHVKIHTGEDKNSCHLCDYSTIQRQCLAKHMANCHGLAQEQIQGLLTEMKIKNKVKRKYINDM